MTLYSGDAVTITVVVTDPVHSVSLDYNAGISLTVDFYAPPMLPATNLADRASPTISSAVMTYDLTAAKWVLVQSTSGFAAGKWWYRVTVAGAYASVEFGNFVVRA